MKFKGLIKIVILLLIDYIAIYNTLGPRWANIIVIIIGLYTWLGEYINLFKDCAISLEHLDKYDKDRLIQIHNLLTKNVKNTLGQNISYMKLHIIPSNDINAFCYGFNNIAITRLAFDVCDDMTLCSILAHEISHALNLDAVFKRVVFTNVILLIILFTISSIISTSFLWIIFTFLCLCGLCGGIFSILVFKGMKQFIKWIFTTVQYVILFIYNLVMGVVSRSSEYRADKLSWSLGYGDELSYFLERFLIEQRSYDKTLQDIIYASHPPTNKRIMRLNNYNKKTHDISNVDH